MADTIMANTTEQPVAEVHCSDSDASTSGGHSSTAGSHGDTSTDGHHTDSTEPEVSAEMKRIHEDTNEPAEESTCKRIKTSDVPGIVEDLEKKLSRPIIFGIRRQAVCESLPYFNSYNSSLYTQNSVARGFYMNKEARSQDKFSAQVIITNM